LGQIPVTEKPKILGIDPGSRVVGFALIGAVKAKPVSPKDWVVLDVGVIRTSTELSMPARLGQIHGAIFDLLSEMAPQYAAIEKAFHGVNAGTALKLGEARGAIIAAFSRRSVPTLEITPAEVKRIIAGNGAASKEQVYQALQALLGFERGRLPLDASDALAIAYASALARLGPMGQVFTNVAKKNPKRS
jgi:crossover junction endodeoxyribonuclease RuvC